MGLLKVNGTLEVNQFWPAGQSDADTTKVIVHVGANAFRFQTLPGAPFSVTKVFNGAKVKGSVTKSAIDAKNRITVRLQGIDAPELHYRPATLRKSATPAQRAEFKLVNKEYRQHLGESATVALAQLLKGSNSTTLACTVETYVDLPNDVFDTYGRFVGDVIVRIGNKNININEWIAQQGWAFPTFYTSMSNKEIQTFIAAGATGRTKGRIWSKYKKKIPKFNPSLIFRKAGPVNPAADSGPLTLPKLFRRQTTWWAYTKAGIASSSFKGYLSKKRDELMLTDDFLANGVHSSTTRFLDEFLKTDGTFTLRSEDMVFKEKSSTLVDITGQEIHSW
jgi:endonuclease YncB( thermonuclease family)